MPRRFNFMELFETLHHSSMSDPQRAKVSIPDRTVDYSFFINGPILQDGEQAYFVRSRKHQKDVVSGFASALRALYPDLHVLEKDHGEVDIRYTPRNRRELSRILKSLRAVPIDGGKFPKADATFFGYD